MTGSRTSAQAGLQFPLAFAPNAGQLDSRYAFEAQGGTASFAFHTAGFVLALADRDQKSRAGVVLEVAFEGTEGARSVVADGPGAGRFSVFSSARTIKGLELAESIRYCGLYPGIDLVYTDDGGRLKSTYFVEAGVDASAVRWRYRGAASVVVDDEGQVRVSVVGEGEVLVEKAPVAWQTGAAGRTPVTAAYTVDDQGVVSLAVGPHDSSRPLVIDPTLIWATYYGGSGTDSANDITVDAEGMVYATGYAHSNVFGPNPLPLLTANGAPPFQPLYGGEIGDAFVVKFNPNPSPRLVYSLRIGGGRQLEPLVTQLFGPAPFYPYPAVAGAVAPGKDVGVGLAVGPDGSVVVVGFTEADDFPGTQNGFGIAGVNPLTMVAGTNDAMQAIPGHYGVPAAGVTDAFIAKIGPHGDELVYGTYFGGIGVDIAAKVAIDAAGNAYVVGFSSGSFSFTAYETLLQITGSTIPAIPSFEPNPQGLRDGFVLKLDPQGHYINATYLGGSDEDSINDIALGPDGLIYVAGSTESVDLPAQTILGAGNVIQNFYWGKIGLPIPFSLSFPVGDGFFAVFDSDLSTLVYSTYFGTSGDDAALSLDVDDHGIAFVTGFSNGDVFLAKIDPRGTGLGDFLGGITWGGNGVENARGVDVSEDRVYIVGETKFQQLPTLNAIQGVFSRGQFCPSPTPSPATPYNGATNPAFALGLASGFVAVFRKSDLLPLSATYLGGPGNDALRSVAVRNRVAYVVGSVQRNSNAPILNPFSESQLPNSSIFSDGSFGGQDYPCFGASMCYLAAISYLP